MRTILYILVVLIVSSVINIKSNMKPIKHSLNYKELLAKLGLA